MGREMTKEGGKEGRGRIFGSSPLLKPTYVTESDGRTDGVSSL